jgi:cytidine deaminase
MQIDNFDNGSAYVGCCIVYKRDVVFGYNQYCHNGKIESLHAEMDAFQKLPQFSKHTIITMVVFRSTKNDTLTMARPCCHCIPKIKKLLKIKNCSLKGGYVWYSNWDGNVVKEKLSEM